MVHAQTATANVDTMIFEIVGKIADREGVDPVELTPPLFEAIDPDALGEIAAAPPTAGQTEVRVTFPYNGYEVTVGPDDVKVVSG
ncbi:HalOD1 output domain-containing protein [Halorubrum sp. AD140]|uniref:HalOD1 output domain-containing protein n=1 Tax=Halorubrum sp. AD140 TaxID=3050073 RepID=UPI002ACCB183|nr:HalOD1 output domain-containing protein [Halorubrum sp. AD140]MDZ5810964.1 HalOD1 output domain-containing protein [Halorubrum sp. AD140]